MAHFDRLADRADEDYIFQVGTLSGNPVAAVAGLATLEILKRPGTYEQVFATGRELMAALDGLLKKAGIPAQVIGEPPLFDVIFTDQPVRDYRDTLKGDKAMATRFNQVLRAQRHHEGREQVLCEPGPHPRRHRPHDRGLDRGGCGSRQGARLSRIQCGLSVRRGKWSARYAP